MPMSVHFIVDEQVVYVCNNHKGMLWLAHVPEESPHTGDPWGITFSRVSMVFAEKYAICVGKMKDRSLLT